ncbi:MAG: hypothetical protein J6I96_01955 [Oscillospiraceae bacterium]|nr:hypothetical protein [Oscillospiraceae bacterium]
MTDNQREWARQRDELVRVLTGLGYPAELGYEAAKMLGSPKSISRMTSYLIHTAPDVTDPKSMEMIADEIISIRSDADRWRERKDSLKANRKYNEILNNGFDTSDED